MSDFKRADGFSVCLSCGAVYSAVLEVCPQCGERRKEKEEPLVIRKVVCDAGHLCPMGNLEPICCVSCDGMPRCPKVCHRVSFLRRIEDLQKVIGWDEFGGVTIYGKVFCSQAVIGDERT